MMGVEGGVVRMVLIYRVSFEQIFKEDEVKRKIIAMVGPILLNYRN